MATKAQRMMARTIQGRRARTPPWMREPELSAAFLRGFAMEQQRQQGVAAGERREEFDISREETRLQDQQDWMQARGATIEEREKQEAARRKVMFDWQLKKLQQQLERRSEFDRDGEAIEKHLATIPEGPQREQARQHLYTQRARNFPKIARPEPRVAAPKAPTAPTGHEAYNPATGQMERRQWNPATGQFEFTGVPTERPAALAREEKAREKEQKDWAAKVKQIETTWKADVKDWEAEHDKIEDKVQDLKETYGKKPEDYMVAKGKTWKDASPAERAEFLENYRQDLYQRYRLGMPPEMPPLPPSPQQRRAKQAAAQEAVQLARGGDVEAQKLCDELGLKWRE